MSWIFFIYAPKHHKHATRTCWKMIFISWVFKTFVGFSLFSGEISPLTHPAVTWSLISMWMCLNGTVTEKGFQPWRRWRRSHEEFTILFSMLLVFFNAVPLKKVIPGDNFNPSHAMSATFLQRLFFTSCLYWTNSMTASLRRKKYIWDYLETNLSLFNIPGRKIFRPF